jgi:hypothetical protein
MPTATAIYEMLCYKKVRNNGAAVARGMPKVSMVSSRQLLRGREKRKMTVNEVIYVMVLCYK